MLDPKGLEAATDAIVTAAYTGEPDEVSREYCADFANAAIRAYLEATGEAKPVAWRYKLYEGEPEWTVSKEKPSGAVVEPLYAAPAPATLAQEEIKALNDLASTYPGDIDGSIRSAIAALSAPSTPEGWRHDCATEGCGKPASVHFIRGGIGSYYCHDCYLKVQALPAAPTATGGR